MSPTRQTIQYDPSQYIVYCHGFTTYHAMLDIRYIADIPVPNFQLCYHLFLTHETGSAINLEISRSFTRVHSMNTAKVPSGTNHSTCMHTIQNYTIYSNYVGLNKDQMVLMEFEIVDTKLSPTDTNCYWSSLRGFLLTTCLWLHEDPLHTMPPSNGNALNRLNHNDILNVLHNR